MRFCRYAMYALMVLITGIGPSCSTAYTPSSTATHAAQDAIPRLGLESPYPGVVRGIVTANTAHAAESGFIRTGFVLQAPQGRADKDPTTPNGIFVRIKHGRSLPYKDRDYFPQVGDELILRGVLGEENGAPVLDLPILTKIIRQGVDLDVETPPFIVNPPATIASATPYWHARYGTRCVVPAHCIVQGYHASRWKTLRSSITLIPPTHAIAKQTSPFEQRLFRDEHPLDDLPARFDNENGARIYLSDAVLRHATGVAETLLPPAHTFDTLAVEVEGVVLHDGYNYVVEVTSPVHFTRGPEPDTNKPRRVHASDAHLSVATYNLENLYDRHDDPFDSRDFQMPSTNRVFNYVPRTEEEYQNRLGCLAQQIISDLRAPDILVLQEIEDQDIACLRSEALLYETADNRDGQPDPLQDLALAIRARGGPDYVAGYDRFGADDRGISSAFMYRPDRVALVEEGEARALMKDIPALSGAGSPLVAAMGFHNPRSINALHPDLGVVFERPPQVAVFKAMHAALRSTSHLYVLNNHFASRPDKFVEERKAQTAFNAAIVQHIYSFEPDANVIVAGDLNTFPRPCEPVPAEPADQLGALYEAGLSNLYDVQIDKHPSSAYSYVYQGQAQTLDHLFVSPSLMKRLVQVIPLHINSDYAPLPAFQNRGCSDHDPQVVLFEFGE